jgi:ribosomal protein uL23
MFKMEPYKIIKNPLSTEKSIKLMEAENKLIFEVAEKAKKKEIKEAIEKIFKVKVESVRTFTNSRGQKRAYVKLSPDTPAIDIATEIGMM